MGLDLSMTVQEVRLRVRRRGVQSVGVRKEHADEVSKERR